MAAVCKADIWEGWSTSVSTVSDTIDHSVVDPRFHPIHWRFQELFMEHDALRGGDPQDIGEWALRVYQTVRELLDQDHECVAVAESLFHELKGVGFCATRPKEKTGNPQSAPRAYPGTRLRVGDGRCDG